MSLSISPVVSKIQQQDRGKTQSEPSTMGQRISPSCFRMMTLCREQCCVQGETCRASTPEKHSHRRHLESKQKAERVCWTT